ncbi:MAG TPA: hypothetical protein VM639_24380 [Dongiaceae bacterium]|nr:hypothetical protein [Dongiaceae bacterium]
MISYVDCLHSSYDGKIPQAEMIAARAKDAELARRVRGHGEQLYRTLENLTDRLRQIGGASNASFIAEAEQTLREAVAEPVTEADRPIEAEMLRALQAAESFISGFEDNALQEGIPALLSQIQRATARAGGL